MWDRGSRSIKSLAASSKLSISPLDAVDRIGVDARLREREKDLRHPTDQSSVRVLKP